MIAQLSEPMDTLPSALEELYEKIQKNKDKQPDKENLIGCLQQLITSFGDVFIVIDALDECPERREVLSLFKAMISWKFSHLRILITSRDESDIRETLAPVLTAQLSINEDLVDADIRTHVAQELKKGELAECPSDLKWAIENTLTRGAHGMYVFHSSLIGSHLNSCLIYL
jgi:hypothetical protein